jgi:Tfp pilus assembly protein PilZ
MDNKMKENGGYEGDRRKSPRREAVFDVDYSFFIGGEGKPLLENVVSANIGGGGLCVLTRDSWPVGAKVLVIVEIPRQQELVNAITRVVWAKELGNGRYRAGLEYTFITREDRNRLEHWLEESG